MSAGDGSGLQPVTKQLWTCARLFDACTPTHEALAGCGLTFPEPALVSVQENPMRPPPKSYTIEYFSSLGYAVTREQQWPKGECWKISGNGLPLDGRTFPTLLLLWAEWMDYAAERIQENYLANHFQERLSKADDAGKLAIASELKRWYQGNASDQILKALRRAPGGSTDKLPKDWKKRMGHLMDEDKLLPLRLVIDQLISPDSIETT